MKKIILVIGGTGLLGQPVSCSLKDAGWSPGIQWMPATWKK
jgi:nucleoside-diphosphate-sugar epimerase